jgi:hypothetical protein
VSGIKPALRACLGVLFVLSLLLSTALTLPVRAAGPAALPYGPTLVGDLKPVEFSYLSLDAEVTAAGNGVTVGVTSRARLRNTDKQSGVTRQLSFAGPVTSVRTGTQNGGLNPAEGADPWSLNLAADGDAVISGVQNVAAGGPVIDLQLDWDALGAWGQTPGSLRLTVHLPDDFDPEQLLAADPAPTERDATHLIWSYENQLPTGKLQVLFVAPAPAQALHAARAAAAGGKAGAAEYLALAGALRPLIDAEGMPAIARDALRAELQGALRQAVAAGPGEARTHDELATFLRAGGAGDPAKLAEAAREYKAALSLNASDAALKQRLLATIDELIAACRKANDTPGVLAALDLAEGVDAQRSQERVAAYADLAVDQIGAGEVRAGETTIAAGFGQPAVERYAFLRPLFSAVTGEVESHADQRRFVFTLVPAPGLSAAAERSLSDLAAAMGRVPGAQVKQTQADGQLRLEINLGSPGNWAATGQALAATVTSESDPALALIATAVGTRGASLASNRSGLQDKLSYAETADLAPAQAALAARMEQLKYARAEADAKTDDPLEAARRRWASALLQRYEAGWYALAVGSGVTYRLLPPDNLAVPSWTLAWGEQRSLAWTLATPRYDRLRPWLLGVAGVAVVMMVMGVVLRRRS